jgi:hypothetical protein
VRFLSLTVILSQKFWADSRLLPPSNLSRNRKVLSTLKHFVVREDYIFHKSRGWHSQFICRDNNFVLSIKCPEEKEAFSSCHNVPFGWTKGQSTWLLYIQGDDQLWHFCFLILVVGFFCHQTDITKWQTFKYFLIIKVPLWDWNTRNFIIQCQLGGSFQICLFTENRNIIWWMSRKPWLASKYLWNIQILAVGN